jgi:alpha-glucoside transport system permease protein
MNRPGARLNAILNKIPLHAAIIIMCALWLLPTIGLLVTSFRPVQAVNETGWWATFAAPPGGDEYAQYCAACHGPEGDAIPAADLSDPEVVGEYRRSYLLAETFENEYDGAIHVPEGERPDEYQLADILDHMRQLSGMEQRPRLWLRNYVDALSGYRGRLTYVEECYEAEDAPRTQPGVRTCNFLEDATISQAAMGRAFLNSVLVTIPATILPILFAAFAAYAFAWLDFRGRQVLFALLVGLQIVPLQMTFVPVYRLYAQLGLNGTFIGIWLFHTGFGLPYAIYLLRNSLGGLPREVFESAYLDGASPVTAFFRLALPLATPAIASLGIFQFLWVWNDLLVALIFLGGDRPVLTYQISNMVTSLGAGWHLLTAAAFISMLLPMLVFFGLQRFFVRGLLAGSVKG